MSETETLTLWRPVGYWALAEHFPAFNAAIVGLIEAARRFPE